MKAQLTPFVSETTVFDDLGKFDIACAAPLHYRYLYGKIIALKQEIQNQKATNSNSTRELDVLNKKLEKTKVFISGGDKISAHELLKMEQLFGKPIVNGYGNNEMVGATIISPLYATKPNSVGIPMKDINVGIFDPKTNLKTENNTEGEICFNSDNFFVGYLNNEEETLRIKQKHSDGSEWIHTGDLGYIDTDGYVYLSGRNKRLIKRKAFKIAPETIESIITNVDEVKDCVVVGVTEMDDDNSSVPLAWVELYPEFSGQFEQLKNKIQKACVEQLPDYEVPEYIVSIDKMPYKNGKHAFKQLEEMGEKHVQSLLSSDN